jgi:4-alpha-glucanotransferase
MSAAPSVTSALAEPALAEALRLLGKTDLLLAVHDASFPGQPGEDCARGSPYGEGALALACLARQLGFTGLLLGPQGQTSAVNRSPYDGSLFSRNVLSLDLKAMVAAGLLTEPSWRRLLADNPRPDGQRVAYTYACAVHTQADLEIHARHLAACRQGDPLALQRAERLDTLWRGRRWLRDDALYARLCEEHGQRAWRHWPQDAAGKLDQALPAPTEDQPEEQRAAATQRRQALEASHAAELQRYALIQLLLIEQHQTFRARLNGLGLKLYGDVQVGIAQGDAWSRQSLLLRDYLMGAPPSRTNRDGQPWSYPVLDPAQYLDARGRPGPVLNFIAERLGKMLAEFDGLRLDHPHGLVCPWVYRANDPDPYHAVQHGARLFSSPDLPDHADLARHAIVRAEQLDRQKPRYDDHWIRELSPEQEERYALLMDALMAQVEAHGRRKQDILCEVLSTEPLPLRRVRERHGLGRFRVTQKADLDDPDDVYRGENAEPQDWVMVGNHDTPSIWRLAQTWHGTPQGRQQAAYLAARLRPQAPDELAALLASAPWRLAQAKLAELFLSPARHVMLFFADLFGLEETYNQPGVVNADNWTLRVPPDFAQRHQRERRQGRAFDPYAALALALRARPALATPELLARLDRQAGWRIDQAGD